MNINTDITLLGWGELLREGQINMEEHMHVPTHDRPPECYPEILEKTSTPRGLTDLTPTPWSFFFFFFSLVTAQ